MTCNLKYVFLSFEFIEEIKKKKNNKITVKILVDAKPCSQSKAKHHTPSAASLLPGIQLRQRCGERCYQAERTETYNITKESNQKASVSIFTKTHINGVAVMTKVPKRHTSAFHAMKYFGLNFQKFPEANETAISGIQGDSNLLRHTEIFGNYRSMTCLTEFPELSVQ